MIEATADQAKSKLCALLMSSDFARVFLAGLCYCQVAFLRPILVLSGVVVILTEVYFVT